MLTISADAQVGHARAMLGRAVRQLPFVTAVALTETVRLAQIGERRSLPSVFDRPTPFTQRGISIRTASKTAPTAAVYVRPLQAEAGLLIQETGGVRTPEKRALVIPAGARLNAYGNLSKGQVRNLLGRPRVFSGTVKGTPGIWERPRKQKGRQGRKLSPKLLIGYEDRQTFKPRFGFVPRARKIIVAAVGPAFREAMTRALRTAR